MSYSASFKEFQYLSQIQQSYFHLLYVARYLVPQPRQEYLGSSHCCLWTRNLGKPCFPTTTTIAVAITVSQMSIITFAAANSSSQQAIC